MKHAFVFATALLACQPRSTSDQSAPLREPAAAEQPAVDEESTERPVSSGVQDGDLIFQESTSRQSELVGMVTGSRWTHMGVLFKDTDGVVVLEAVSPVRETALEKWIARGRDGVYVVKRLRDAERDLSSSELKEMRRLGSTWLGRPYDLQFRWDDEALYCSELAYKLFDRAAGVRLGKLEKGRRHEPPGSSRPAGDSQALRRRRFRPGRDGGHARRHLS